MSKLAEISAKMDGLRIRLSYPSSGEEKLLDIEHFIRVFLTDLSTDSLALSFLLELIEPLSSALNELRMVGLTPTQIDAAIGTFEGASAQMEDVSVENIFGVVSVRLRQIGICLFAHIGSRADAIRLIDPEQSDTTEKSFDETSSPEDFVRTLTRVFRPDWIDDIDAILLKWNACLFLPHSTCLFPVISTRFENHNGNTDRRGQLRTLELTLSGWTSGPDRIEIRVWGVGEDQSSDNLITPIQTARLYLEEDLGIPLARGFAGVFRFSIPNISHSGQSALLAMTALYVIEAQHFTEQRFQSQLQAGVVLSGSLSSSGKILDIDPDSISEKVSASFYSPATFLVLPQSQVHLARIGLNDLKSLHPNRNLQIVGIETLSDLFSDRRLVRVTRRNIVTHLANKTWNRRASVVPSFLLVFILALVVWSRFFSTDQHPWSVSYEASGISVQNQNSDVIGHIPISHYQVEYFKSSLATVLGIEDINGDGYKDIVWCGLEGNSVTFAGSVRAWDGKKKRMLWDQQTVYQLSYDRDISITHGRMAPTGIFLSDVDNDGSTEVFIVARHVQYYPTVLLELNPISGTPIQRYDHPGSIEHLAASDFDGDGIKEIVFGGTNNAFGEAVLGILDYASLSGFAPAERYYVTREGPTNREVAYIRFLKSPIHDFAPVPYPRVWRLRVSNTDSTIIAEVNDAQDRSATGPMPTSYLYEFDLGLKPVSIGTSSAFDQVWRRAEKAGFIDGPMTSQDKINMLDLALLKTPDGWVPLTSIDH